MQLIDRLKAATGPDRELDADIAIASGLRLVEKKWVDFDEEEWFYDHFDIVPRYTASIDAALALVERMLPDANCWGFDKTPNTVDAYVSRNSVSSGHWVKEGTPNHPSPSPFSSPCSPRYSERTIHDTDNR